MVNLETPVQVVHVQLPLGPHSAPYASSFSLQQKAVALVASCRPREGDVWTLVGYLLRMHTCMFVT